MLHATLHQLKVFETVARHSSFTRAAQELSISQPTVSSQVKQLTKSIGLPLFEQIGKQLYLTDVGRELLLTSQDVFEKLENFEMKVSDFKGTKEGKLRLAVVTTAKYFVPQLLGAFCQQYPAIDISLQVTNHQKLKRRMLENEDDLYILSQPPEDLDLHIQDFLENPLVVVARSDNKLAGKKNIPIECLDREKFIMREPGSGTRKAIEKLLKKHNLSIEVRLELGSNEAIKQAILGNLGISILSRHTLRYELERGELIVLDVQNFPIQRHWYVAYLGGKQLSVVASAFLQHLLAKSPEYVDSGNLKRSPK